MATLPATITPAMARRIEIWPTGRLVRDQDVLHIRCVYSGRRGQLKDLATFYRVDRSTIKRVAASVSDGQTCENRTSGTASAEVAS
jgi:hypothetical protein